MKMRNIKAALLSSVLILALAFAATAQQRHSVKQRTADFRAVEITEED